MKLSQKQIGELIELLDKEEIIDVENKIQKALQKEIEHENQIDVDAELQKLSGNKVNMHTITEIIKMQKVF